MADFKEIQIGENGQVYQVKDETARGNQGGYTPPAGGIPKTDLANDVQTSLGKADTALQQADKTQLQNAINSLQNALNTITQDGATQGAIDTFNEVVAFLNGISSSDTLAAKLATLVPQTRTVNGKALSSNVTIGINDIDGLAAAIANAGSGAVSVTTNQDGTFVIHVGETDYTINLNHVHPQYLDIDDIDEYITAGSNVTITRDSQTGVLEISASGGSGSQVQANWNESDSTSAAYIQNKPTIPTVPTNVSSFTNDANYLKFQLCADEAAYNAITTKDSSTLYLILES